MTRLFVDCRDYPSEMNCTVAISADTKEELVDAAVHTLSLYMVIRIAHNCARSWPR